jgi:hypothetical protein
MAQILCLLDPVVSQGENVELDIAIEPLDDPDMVVI